MICVPHIEQFNPVVFKRNQNIFRHRQRLYCLTKWSGNVYIVLYSVTVSPAFFSARQYLCNNIFKVLNFNGKDTEKQLFNFIVVK